MILKNKIKKIIDVIAKTEITEIEVSSFWGAQKIKLKKGKDFDSKSDLNIVETKPHENEQFTNTVTDNVSSNNAVIEPKEEKPNSLQEEISEGTVIKAPLVGTFYLSPKPGEPPFIEQDKKIDIGDTLCIIEAMKIFNDIESEHKCIIKQILVNDGEPVEYDQPLFLIEEI